MRCKKVISLFSAYLDGQLTAAERNAVREHLAGCERCRAELKELDWTAYAVADLPRRQAPAELRNQVMAKIAGVTPDEARLPGWRMYWAAAAAILLAVIIMLLTARNRTKPEVVASAPASAATAQVAIEKEPVKIEGALADRSISTGRKDAEEAKEDELRTVSNVLPAYGPLIASAAPAATVSLDAAPVSPIERIGFVFRSESPRTDYLNAVTVAAKGGWLPNPAAELLLADEQEHAKQQRDKKFPLQLKLRMKRSQVQALKEALAAVSLPQTLDLRGAAQAPSAEQVPPAGPAQAAQVQENQALPQAPSARPMRVAGGQTGMFAAGRSSAPAGAFAVPGGAEPARPSEAAPTSAATGETGVAKLQQIRLENGAGFAGAATAQQARKAARAEDPIVEVTLRFEPLTSPPAAPAPAAGAANSATPQ